MQGGEMVMQCREDVDAGGGRVGTECGDGGD